MARGYKPNPKRRVESEILPGQKESITTEAPRIVMGKQMEQTDTHITIVEEIVHAHTHKRADITDFFATPFYTNIPDRAHTHAPNEISPQGHDSGLDADLLDGQHASAFAAASHTHVKADITDFAHASTHERGGSDVVRASRLYSGLDANKPTTGNVEGDVWWATDTDKLYIWDGSAWKEIGGGSGGSLTMFTGIVSKDYDPPARLYDYGWTSLITYDVGADGWLQPMYLKLPVAVIDIGTGYPVKPGVRFHYHDGTYIEILNSSTISELIKGVDDLVKDLMPTNKNGTSIRKIEFGAFYDIPFSEIGDLIDLGVFQIRAYAHAKGTGGAL